MLTCCQVWAFAPAVSTPKSTETSRLHAVPVYGLLGRFRDRKKVKQQKQIGVGDSLPNVDVELFVPAAEAGEEPSSVATSIQDVFGLGSTVLVGKFCR